jgi:hypothetical protein
VEEGSKYKKGIKVKNYVDSSKYEGEVVNDKRNGKGIYYYSNGDSYIGDWKDDRYLIIVYVDSMVRECTSSRMGNGTRVTFARVLSMGKACTSMLTATSTTENGPMIRSMAKVH